MSVISHGDAVHTIDDHVVAESSFPLSQRHSLLLLREVSCRINDLATDKSLLPKRFVPVSDNNRVEYFPYPSSLVLATYFLSSARPLSLLDGFTLS